MCAQECNAESCSRVHCMCGLCGSMPLNYNNIHLNLIHSLFPFSIFPASFRRRDRERRREKAHFQPLYSLCSAQQRLQVFCGQHRFCFVEWNRMRTVRTWYVHYVLLSISLKPLITFCSYIVVMGCADRTTGHNCVSIKRPQYMLKHYYWISGSFVVNDFVYQKQSFQCMTIWNLVSDTWSKRFVWRMLNRAVVWMQWWQQT